MSKRNRGASAPQLPSPKKEPAMTKAQIEDRIKLLETEKENVKATLVAYDGAIQDCKYWLEQLDKPEVTKD